MDEHQGSGGGKQWLTDRLHAYVPHFPLCGDIEEEKGTQLVVIKPNAASPQQAASLGENMIIHGHHLYVFQNFKSGVRGVRFLCKANLASV